MPYTMEFFTIHASKDGNWIETQDTSPTLTVAKANSLHKTGWNVHIRDLMETVRTNKVQ